MNTVEIATKLAQKFGLKAHKFNIVLREFDNKVELIGLINDPTLDISDFRGREMLFPKRWVTMRVLDADTKVPA